ncbi:hypothetical protein ACSNN5_12030 [Brevibacillus formosus]
MSNKHITILIFLSYLAKTLLDAEPNMAHNNKAAHPISIVTHMKKHGRL